MDLNLDNYSDIEIINLLHLPIKDNYTLAELKNNTLDHVKVILNTEDEMLGNKREITNFFIKAFLRLAKKFNVKVDPFEMQEFESVKAGLLPPLEENHINDCAYYRRDISEIESLPTNFDKIYHLAALSRIQPSFNNKI